VPGRNSITHFQLLQKIAHCSSIFRRRKLIFSFRSRANISASNDVSFIEIQRILDEQRALQKHLRTIFVDSVLFLITSLQRDDGPNYITSSQNGWETRSIARKCFLLKKTITNLVEFYIIGILRSRATR
jgi:hypothetical protein